jgi:hypothetical protein
MQYFARRPRFSSSRWIALGLTALLLGLVVACSKNQPVLLYEDTETRDTIKRIARHHSVDYTYRCRSVAYDRNSRQLKGRSEDEKKVLELHGQPDYLRRPFTSQYSEKTREWIHTEANRLFQFVGGTLVHSQEISDIERTMVSRGYPRYYSEYQDMNSPLRQNLMYRGSEGHSLITFSFTNGELITRTQ